MVFYARSRLYVLDHEKNNIGLRASFFKEKREQNKTCIQERIGDAPDRRHWHGKRVSQMWENAYSREGVVSEQAHVSTYVRTCYGSRYLGTLF